MRGEPCWQPHHLRSNSGVLKPLALLFLLPAFACAASIEVELQSPLNTVVRCAVPHRGNGAKTIEAVVEVPANAPADLGVGAFVTDQHGRWFQRYAPGRLAPGSHRLSFRISPDDQLVSEPNRAGWSSAANAVSNSGGLFFWSASSSHARIRCTTLAIKTDSAASDALEYALADVSMSGLSGGNARARTGERWTINARPLPFPANPYDAEEFALEAAIVTPGGENLTVPGFYLQPMDHFDRGDREVVKPTAASYFQVRFRAREPGRYKVTLKARWRDAAGKARSASYACPRLIVDGPEWDDFVRVDAKDPRFFSVNGACFWPIGFNLRSVGDVRTRKYLNTKLTPNRGFLSYDAYLRRLAGTGGDAVEIWLSSWNLALEWRADWPGFYGQGRYHEENAWRLDRILDLCDELGMRVNLVINNHGQGSTNTDEEWDNNPHATKRGGKLNDAQELFNDAWALASQERMRRYIVARYGDHPSVMAWKLWSEINLTNGGPFLRNWHDQASQRWHALDIYNHPVTTHWSGDFRSVDRSIVALPGLDFTCIDAYHAQPTNRAGQALAELLADGVKRLGTFNKPLFVTEYGGHWDACPEPQLIAEHLSGGWAALVTGNAGQPLLWWSEWVDQKDLWQPYRALSRFLKGEDLRSPSAKTVAFAAIDAIGSIWARAWSRPGRMFGYLLDTEWANSGAEPPLQTIAKLQVGSGIAAGRLRVEWWDAEQGVIVKTDTMEHPGGELVILAPPFQRHIAFKLIREQAAPVSNPAAQEPEND